MHCPSTFAFLRRLPLLVLGWVLLAIPAPAQVNDDMDVDLNSAFWRRQGLVRCLRLASTDEEVVAVFIQQSPIVGVSDDKLMVAVSRDKGRSWRSFYRARIGEEWVLDMAVVVAHRFPGHPQNRWIYILQETLRPNVWDPSTWARGFSILAGPLDRHWYGGSNYPPYGFPIGGTLKANPYWFDQALQPTLTIAPYDGSSQYMVVAAHRWVDDGDSRIVAHTPYSDARGSAFGTGWRVVAGPGGVLSGGEYAHPSLAADPVGRSIVLAFEDRATGTVIATMADAETYHRGGAMFRPEFVSDRMRGVRSAPHVGIHNNTAVMTALGTPVINAFGAHQLHWYWKQRGNPFREKGMLHGLAFSSAPVVNHQGQVYAVAHVVVDPSPMANSARAMAFHGAARDTSLTGTWVGDHLVLHGTPTLAVVQEGSDRGVYGYTEVDRWDRVYSQGLWIDPGR